MTSIYGLYYIIFCALSSCLKTLMCYFWNMAKTYVGTSGFNYKHWAGGVFYPNGLPQSQWLDFYSQRLDTVELNTTFYRLPQKSVFEGWYEQVPGNFIFAVKGNRFITQQKKLKDPEEPVKKFFDNAIGLGDKLSIVLWQLPPNFSANPERLTKFCETLKKNAVATTVRHTFEFRHESWFLVDVYKILRDFGYALCIADSPVWPLVEEATTDYIYIRFHGGHELYGSNYSDAELKNWAKKIKKWLAEGKDVYAYFNNDAHGYAVQNAKKLKELLH